jgi:hypothetical protein
MPFPRSHRAPVLQLTIHPLYTHYTPTIHPLYTHYTPTIHPLYTHYTPVLQLKIVDSENYDTELARDGEAVGELLIKGPW